MEDDISEIKQRDGNEKDQDFPNQSFGLFDDSKVHLNVSNSVNRSQQNNQSGSIYVKNSKGRGIIDRDQLNSDLLQDLQLQQTFIRSHPVGTPQLGGAKNNTLLSNTNESERFEKKINFNQNLEKLEMSINSDSTDATTITAAQSQQRGIDRLKRVVNKIREEKQQQLQSKQDNNTSTTSTNRRSIFINGNNFKSENLFQINQQEQIQIRNSKFMQQTNDLAPEPEPEISRGKFIRKNPQNGEENSSQTGLFFENLFSRFTQSNEFQLKRSRSDVVDEKSAENQKILKVTEKIDRIDRLAGYQFEYPFLIIPCGSQFKLYWDFFVMVLILWIALYIPFVIAFSSETASEQEWTILSIFIVDILLNFRTTFFNEEKEEIVSGKQIAMYYIKSINFYADVFSALPIVEFMGDGVNKKTIKLVNLTQILRLLRLGRLLKLLQSEKLQIYGNILKNLLSFLLLLHWLTCLWFFIVTSQYPGDDQVEFNKVWIPSNMRIIMQSSNSIQENAFVVNFYDPSVTPLIFQYSYTIYSTFMLILGGDISPPTIEQSITLSIIVIIGQITLATLFGNMSLLIFKMNQNSAFKNSMEEQLELMLRHQKAKPKVREKVMEYFSYCWRQKVIFDKDLSNFSDLSETLQRECLIFIHQEQILNVPIFSNLEINQLLALVLKLKTIVFMPLEAIGRRGDQCDEMYFVSQGIVEEITYLQKPVIGGYHEHGINLQERMVQTTRLKKGDQFLETQLMTRSQLIKDYNSVDFVILESLSTLDFEAWRNQFQDVNIRLQKGLQMYREKNADDLAERILNSQHPVFKGMEKCDVELLVSSYFCDILIESNSYLIFPEQEFHNLYLLMTGTISQNSYVEDENFPNDPKEKLINDEILNQLNCIDQTIDQALDQNLYLDTVIDKYVKQQQDFESGDVFGVSQFSQDIKAISKYMYHAESSCHISVITQDSIEKLSQDEPNLFQIIKRNSIEFINLSDQFLNLKHGSKLPSQLKLQPLPIQDPHEVSAGSSNRSFENDLAALENQFNRKPSRQSNHHVPITEIGKLIQIHNEQINTLMAQVNKLVLE